MARKMEPVDHNPMERVMGQSGAANDGVTGIISALHDAIFIVDLSSRTILACNKAVEVVFGYHRDQLLGRNTRLLHVDSGMYEKFAREASMVLDNRETFKKPYRMRRKDGSLFDSFHIVKAVAGEKRNRREVLSVVRDLSNENDALGALPENQEQFRMTLENVNAIVAFSDIDLRYAWISNAPCHFTPGEVIGRRDIDVMRNPQECILGEITTAESITAKEGMNQCLRVQHDLIRQLSCAGGLNESLPLVMAAAKAVSGAESGGIYLVEKDGSLSMKYATGISPAFREAVSRFPADSPNARMVLAGKPLYGFHRKIDLPLSEAEKREGFAGVGIVPVAGAEGVAACLIISSRDLEQIPPDRRLAIETVAAAMGLAISRHQCEGQVSSLKNQYRRLMAACQVTVVLTRLGGRMLEIWPGEEALTGEPRSGTEGKHLDDILPAVQVRFLNRMLQKAIVSGSPVCGELMPKTGEAQRQLKVDALPLDGEIEGEPAAMLVFHDTPPVRDAKAALSRKDAALRELVEQMAAEKSRMGRAISETLEASVLPLLAKLRLKGAPTRYVDMVEHHLKTLASDPSRSGISFRTRLTPREREICDMIRNGLTSKEIAELLDLSAQTVHRHRRNIRKRLGLTGRGQNLSSFLMDA